MSLEEQKARYTQLEQQIQAIMDQMKPLRQAMAPLRKELKTIEGFFESYMDDNGLAELDVNGKTVTIQTDERVKLTMERLEAAFDESSLAAFRQANMETRRKVKVHRPKRRRVAEDDA
tara:strand:+ start:216 stop:569 length:354 start_codon:yes stop_codon:yes gene_type:complete